MFAFVPDGKRQLGPALQPELFTEVRDEEGAPLSLHPYLADATAGEDTSVQLRTAASPSARPPPEYAPHCPQVSALCASRSTRCCSWMSADRIRTRGVPPLAAPARPHRPHSRPPPEYARIRSPLSAGLSRRIEKHSVLQLGGARRPHSDAVLKALDIQTLKSMKSIKIYKKL